MNVRPRPLILGTSPIGIKRGGEDAHPQEAPRGRPSKASMASVNAPSATLLPEG